MFAFNVGKCLAGASHDVESAVLFLTLAMCTYVCRFSIVAHQSGDSMGRLSKGVVTRIHRRREGSNISDGGEQKEFSSKCSPRAFLEKYGHRTIPRGSSWQVTSPFFRRVPFAAPMEVDWSPQIWRTGLEDMSKPEIRCEVGHVTSPVGPEWQCVMAPVC